MDHSSSTSKLPSLNPPAWTQLTTALRVRTVFPYEAQRDQDLSFIENVVIEAHPAKDPMGAWWYGTLVKEGKKGWFPSAYIEEMSRKSDECAPQECTSLLHHLCTLV